MSLKRCRPVQLRQASRGGCGAQELQLENLRKAIAELDVQGQNLLSLRYSDALTMDEIGQIYGISKMAVSK